MDATMILLRIVHVVGGVFWVGAMLFVSLFLMPAVTDAGPDGGKVMAGIQRRRFMTIVPIIAITVMLAGIVLYWKASAGFSIEYMRSGAGHSYAFGGIAAILGFIIGMTVTRPSMMKVTQLSQGLQNAEPSERERLMADIQRLRNRANTGSKYITALLLISALTMAIGRYV